MDPKLYYSNFLVSDHENKAFALFPFTPKCLNRYDKIIKPTLEFMGIGSEFSNDEKSGKEIVEKIYDGINSSRILLFDLSSDERYGDGVNPNVAYELGIARMIRNDTDILLLTDLGDIEKGVFFDIRSMNIKRIETNFSKETLYVDLRSICDKQKYYEDKRIEALLRSIDGESMELIYKYGKFPEGYDNFNSRGLSAEFKMSIFRLLDLGLIITAWGCYENGYEYAYYWTRLGIAIMNKLGIKKITLEEFKKLPEYEERLRFEKKYREFKKLVAGA